MTCLATKLAGLMKKTNITDYQLAERIGVSSVDLDSIFSGKISEVSEDVLKKIMNFFNLSLDKFLDYPERDIYISSVERHHRSPGEVLNYLMNDIGGISECELSRRTGVPQPTIHRILSGKTLNPRFDSMRPLADFFVVSVDQMLGRVPLPDDRVRGSFSSVESTKKVVPLLLWDELHYWPSIEKEQNFKMNREWVVSEAEVINSSSFAVKIDSEKFLPDFRKDALIIVDCCREPSPGDFIVARFAEKKEIAIGHYLRVRGRAAFVSLENDALVVKIESGVDLLGVISEVKYFL